MDALRNHGAVKALALLLSAVLPIVFVLFFMNHGDTVVLNVLWCGVYGVILACLCKFPWWVKAGVIAINLVPFGALAMGFLMGGWSGLLWLVGKATLPFVF